MLRYVMFAFNPVGVETRQVACNALFAVFILSGLKRIDGFLLGFSFVDSLFGSVTD